MDSASRLSLNLLSLKAARTFERSISMKANYLIKGLDSLKLNYTQIGNGHFMQNIVPELYELTLVTLAGNVAELAFSPTENVPEELRDSCHEYTLSVHAHKDFSLIIRTASCNTVRYLVLTGVEDVNGKPFFHYDVMQKPVAGAKVTDSIFRDTTYNYLRDNGFEPMERFDDFDSSSFMVIFENGEIK